MYKQQSAVLKKAASSARARSKSRGRSPGRGRPKKAVDTTDSKAEETKAETAQPAEPPKAEKKVEKAEKVEKVKVLKAETPTRASARIAAKAISDAFSDDETEKVRYDTTEGRKNDKYHKFSCSLN